MTLQEFKKFKIGDRVICIDKYNGDAAFDHQHGKIVALGSREFSIEWDNKINSFNPGNKGHDCGGKAKNGHGWYGLYDNSYLILEQLTENLMNITLPSINSMF